MNNYLFYIRKRILSKKWMQLFNIVVSSMALTLLCAAVAVPQILHHGENRIKKSLAGDISKHGVFCNVDYLDLENAMDFISDIYNAPEIDGIGTWTYGGSVYLKSVGEGTDYWNEILEIQNNHVREFDEDPGYVQIVYMPGQAFRINDLELFRGSADQVGHNDGYLLYLGYHFKDIPVGTVFTNERRGSQYSVEGILGKNTSIVDAKALLMNGGGLTLSCSVAMDNMVLIIPPSGERYLSADLFFKCSDEYTYEEASQKIKSIGQQYGIQAETGKLQDRVDTVLSAADWLLNAVAKLSVLLSFSAVIILLTTQLLTILSRKDELGVWLISGMGRKKIFRILFAENLIKMLLSSSVSFGIVILFLKMVRAMAGVSGAVVYELRYIIWVFVPVFLLLCAILITVFCSAITIAYIKKKSIPDIIRGTWE